MHAYGTWRRPPGPATGVGDSSTTSVQSDAMADIVIREGRGPRDTLGVGRREADAAGVAQLAERQPSKLHVAGSIPVSRSNTSDPCVRRHAA
jgi:hypothetical protein